MSALKNRACICSWIFLLIQGLVSGYLVVIDETTEDPNFPEMCVSPYWDRIVPVGFSYPVPRENLPNLHISSSDDVPFTGSSAAYLPPCEAVTCIKKRGHGRENRYSLRIVGCENSIYSTNHDPTCNVYIPDQRLPYPMCCPQRTCSAGALNFLFSAAANSNRRPIQSNAAGGSGGIIGGGSFIGGGAGGVVSGGGVVTGGGTVVSPIAPITSPVQQRSASPSDGGDQQVEGEKQSEATSAVGKVPHFIGQALPPFPFAPILFPTVK